VTTTDRYKSSANDQQAWFRWVNLALDHKKLTGMARELAIHSTGIKFHEPRELEYQPYLCIGTSVSESLVDAGYKGLKATLEITHPGYCLIVDAMSVKQFKKYGFTTPADAIKAARTAIADAKSK